MRHGDKTSRSEELRESAGVCVCVCGVLEGALSIPEGHWHGIVAVCETLQKVKDFFFKSIRISLQVTCGFR